jgi:hypothetical protein
MFGIIRPCRHRLTPALHTSWVAHLCGMCLALRDEHGQFARVVTNYDGVVISALVEAQSTPEGHRRNAGPCPLRGMRTASVSAGDGARLAGVVSLVLASAKVMDHVTDGDGVFVRRPVAGVARKVAGRWTRQSGSVGDRIGFNTAILAEVVDRQHVVEEQLALGESVLVVTEPTETATAAAFAHTAMLSDRPGPIKERNAVALAEAGRLFGRVAHLIDAVEDLDEDRARGVWNPLLATGTDLATARRLCDDAVLGVALALREVEFVDRALVHALLVHELPHAVARAFGDPHGHQHPPGHWQQPAPPLPPGVPPAQPVGAPTSGHPVPPGQSGTDGPPPDKRGKRWPPKDGDGGCCWVPRFQVPARKRNVIFGCAVASYMCCTCQYCCRDPFPGPWSGKPRSSCDCDCGCDSCDCGPCDC